MRLRFAGGPTLLCLALALSLTTSCSRRATQLVVEVSSDLSPARIACVRLDVTRLDDPTDVTGSTFFLEGSLADRSPFVTLPFSLGVVPPGGDAGRRVELHASAYPLEACQTESFEGAPTVSRRVRTGFVPEARVDMPIFLSQRCDGVVCDPTSTCDQGACVPVPDFDPRTGQYLDAGPLDGGASTMDADLDANGDGGALSRPLPAHDFSVGQSSSEDPHGHVYPVGVGLGDTILVAGTTTVGLPSLGLEVSDAGGIDAGVPSDRAAFFLAKLAHGTDGWGTVWAHTFPATAPYPVVERAVAIPDGYVVCGTTGGGFVAGATNVVGTVADIGFVLRLDTAGAVLDVAMIDVVPPDLSAVDAAVTDGGFPHPSPRAFCTDLDVQGQRVLVASQVWAGTALRIHGPGDLDATTDAGALSDDHQSLVLTELSLATTAQLTHVRSTVLGHAELGNGLYALGRDGARLYARHLEDGDFVYAVEADELALEGSSAPTGDYDRPWVARSGGSPFAAHPLVSAVDPPGMRAHLRAMAVSASGVPWVALTVHVEGFAGVDGGMIDASAPPLGTVSFHGGLVPTQSISWNTTFLCALDRATLNVVELVRMPNSQDAGIDDSLLAFADARLESLSSGALFATADDYLLHAANTADGEHASDPVNDTRFAVSSAITGGDAGRHVDELDPVMGIVSPSGRALSWHWTGDAENIDWRLTHAVATPGYVAVAGYVEDQSFDFGHQWRRERSFFQIFARDTAP